ncbi:MAG: DEAD/DEAH box helicase [Spirochaetota bacterium]
MLLKDLQQNVAGLKGLGVRACEKLLRLQIQHISDLLQHYPVRYLNHLEPLSLKAASGKLGEAGNQERHFYIRAQVVEHSFIPWRGGKHGRILKVGLAEADHIEEGSGNVSETAVFGSVRASLLCFGREFLAARMPIGSLILVAGTFQWRYGEFQSSNFVFEVPSDSVPKKPLAKESGAYNGSEFDCLLPVYSLTQGITQKLLRSTIAQALQHFSFAIEDELPLCLQKKYGLLGKKEALRELHFPASFERLALAHQSLVYEELLVLMLLIQRRRLQQHRSLQERHSGSSRFSLGDFGTLMAQARELLPFRLSEGQGRALAEILQCFTLDTPMNRLLQGDVGSGKTIVALLSCLPWLEAGAQVVLMAPTEILAQQLQNNFEMLRQKLEGAEEGNFLSAQAKITGGLGESAFLSGSVSPTQRKEILRSLREGKIRLLVGTHALFSSAVKFKTLR